MRRASHQCEFEYVIWVFANVETCKSALNIRATDGSLPGSAHLTGVWLLARVNQNMGP